MLVYTASVMASNTAPAAVGDIIAGRYRIDAWLGQGNMAVVFRATHLGTSQPCALKLVHSHLVERPEVREMFLKEAHVGARIGRNPHIVDIFDAGFDDARGVPYLAMELLEGEALDRYIKVHGAASPALVRTIFHQVADALEQAHARGVIHRDLKPANLFLTFDRKRQAHIKIVDFGIAKLTEQDVQRTATQIGTPAYAAPEQLGAHMRSIAARQGVMLAQGVGPATDIWPLGLIAYELLVGAPGGHFWTGGKRTELVELLMRIVLEPTPKASEQAGDKAASLPRGFDEWLERCLCKNADDRWPSVQEALKRLAILLDEGYEDEATRQIDTSGANAIVEALLSQKQGEVTKVLALKSMGTLPLEFARDKPNATVAAGPRGTAVLEIKRDATGRPTALSRPDMTDEMDNRGTPPGKLGETALFGTRHESDERAPEPRAMPVVQRPTPQPQPQPMPNAAPAPSIPATNLQAASARTLPTVVVPRPALAIPTAKSTREPASSQRAIWVVVTLVALIGMAIVIARYLPRKGSLNIVVVSAQGTALPPFEVFIDGRKQCTSMPCLVKDLTPGSRSIRVAVEGAPAAVPMDEVVEAGNDKTVRIMVGLPGAH